MTNIAERQVDLILPLIPDVEITAANAAGELAQEIGMGADEIDEMTHAIVEACINAREHSCCADHRIYLRFIGSTTEEGNPKFELWITDHGQGFDPDTVKHKRAVAVAGGPRKRGWGLQIMEAHMDKVEIISGTGGTTVHMIKIGERKAQ